MRSRELRKSQTESEVALWDWLRERKLDGLKFRRQQPIHGFIADFYCDSLGLVVEVDGGAHQSTQDYDQQRDAILEGLGLKVLRFPNEAVLNDVGSVLSRIREAIRALRAENY